MAGQRVAAFAWQLQRQVSEKDECRDAPGFFSSPISLYIAMGLAMAGAGTNSSTRQELYHLLYQDKSPLLGPADEAKAVGDADVEDLLQSLSQLITLLSQQGSRNSKTVVPTAEKGAETIMANGIWTNDKEVEAEYAAQMQELFQAAVRQAEGVDVINEWAAQVTKGLITEAIPPGTQFDVVLTNAVYFKGSWEYAFEKTATKKKQFTLEGGAVTQVDMMTKTFYSILRYSPPVKYRQTSKYEAVHLPYKGGTTSAVIVLPDADSAKYGVAAAAAKLDIGELLDLDRYMPVYYWDLIVELPKFKVKTESVSFLEVLSEMGVKAAFELPSDCGGADFSKLCKDPLYISDVLQSVCVIVDEEGTEAAAVTSVIEEEEDDADASPPPPPVVIAFNRPFLFMVVDDATRTPLFVGTVLDPS